jgi:hypothetical protein
MREPGKLRFRLSKYIEYQMDARLLLISLCFSIATFAVYVWYFDILAPFIPGGSVRSSYGVFFFVPIILLISAQTLFDTWLTHIVIAVVSPSRKDALRAYLVASEVIFLFSVFYVFFPYYGPYTFVVYFTPNSGFGITSYPILVAWTAATILGTSVLIKQVFRLENQDNFGLGRRLLLAATMLAIAMVIAS